MRQREKTIQELDLEDDFLFAKVMSDPEVCRGVLEQILGIPIERVVSPEAQRTIDLLYEGKGIRLDVYVSDGEGTVYNVEMQRGRRRDLPKRARYYQGNVDLDLISAGEPYSALKRTYVIFICTFDPFQDGRHLYTFENICRQNPSLPLGDETAKLFLNTRGTAEDVEPDLREFLEYVENTTDAFAQEAANPLIAKIHERVRKVKQSKEMEVEYMTLMQRDRENIEIGREKGVVEGMVYATQIYHLHMDGFAADEIAARLNLDVHDVERTIQGFMGKA